MTNARRRLRELLQRENMLIAPGAYDGASAMLIEAAGYEAAYMTGAGVSSTYGLPDYGLLTQTEMTEQAGRIASSVRLPVIVDADTGYGNELNVTRTVRLFEQRGVAGLHIEDQVSPKRCGHLTGKEIVSRQEFLLKIRAALAARDDPDLMIIARTDARGVVDFDEAIWRANAAIDAGADMAFVEAPRSVEEAARVPALVKGPCLLNMVGGGVTPVFDCSEAQAMGYRLVIVPGLAFGSMVAAVRAALNEFRATGVHPSLGADLTPAKVFSFFGAAAWDALREPVSEALSSFQTLSH